jgi:hypothetical protein
LARAKRKTPWKNPGEPGGMSHDNGDEELSSSFKFRTIYGTKEDFDDHEDWINFLSGEPHSEDDESIPYVQPDDPAYQLDTLSYLTERIVNIIKVHPSPDFPEALQKFIVELQAFATDIFAETDYGNKLGEIASKLDLASKENKADGLLRTDMQNTRSAFARMKKELEGA